MGQQAVPLAPHVGVRALGDSGIGTRTAWVVCWIVTVRTTCNKSTCKEEANPREIRCLALSLCAWIWLELMRCGGLEIIGSRAVWTRGHSTTIPAPSKTQPLTHAQLDLTTTPPSAISYLSLFRAQQHNAATHNPHSTNLFLTRSFWYRRMQEASILWHS